MNDGSAFILISTAVALLCILLLSLLVNRSDNELHWEDLVATNGALNAYKIGYWIGVALGGWILIQAKTDIASILGVYLAFLGGVPVASGVMRNIRYERYERSDRTLPDVPPPRERGRE